MSLIYRPLPPGRYGWLSISEPGKPTIERDAYLCCHCQTLCVVIPGSGRTRGWCLKCGQPTCGETACGLCVPLEVRLEAEEGTRKQWHGIELAK